MDCLEYMRIPVHMILPKITEEYNGAEYEDNSFMWFEIVKGVYGLPQAVLLSKILLQNGSPHTDLDLHQKYWDCGDMKLVQSNSPLW